VDAVYRKLGRKAPPSPTRTAPLPGASANLDAARREVIDNGPPWLEARSAEYLLRVYGARAVSIVALAEERPELRGVVDDVTGLIGAAVPIAFDEEFARSLIDVVMRRTMVGYNREAGLTAAERIAGLAADTGRWRVDEAEAQLEAYRGYMKRFLPRAMAPHGLLP
jgi:glycerol-3-phosphate dehydrogenase